MASSESRTATASAVTTAMFQQLLAWMPSTGDGTSAGRGGAPASGAGTDDEDFFGTGGP